MIEISTTYTKAAFRKFQWFHIARGGMRKVTFIIGLSVIFIVGTATLTRIMLDGMDSRFELAFPLLLFILPLVYIFTPQIATNAAFRKTPALFDAGLTFCFHESYFTVITTGIISGTSDIRYEALYRVYQTKNYFYLYIQQTQSYIIHKADIKTGNPEEFSAFLQKVIPANKYRSYVK